MRARIRYGASDIRLKFDLRIRRSTSRQNPNDKLLNQGQPIADWPLADRPSADRPLADRPLADRPSADWPLADWPIADRPLADWPLADWPLADRPLADWLLADRPLAGRPLADRPIADWPLADRPSADWLLADWPLAGRPLAGRPLAGRPSGRPARLAANDHANLKSNPMFVCPRCLSPIAKIRMKLHGEFVLVHVAGRRDSTNNHLAGTLATCQSPQDQNQKQKSTHSLAPSGDHHR